MNNTGGGVGGGSGGRCVFDDGGCYSGSWEDGMAHGHGVCTGPSGQGEYAGAWQFGFESSGVYTWTNGNYFEGQWLQGKRHGVGVESKGHWLYRGEWSQGFKGRYGVRQSTVTGIKYEGTWTSGLQDGYGVETYPDGGTFQGQWMRGVRHGYGVRQSVSYDLAVRYHSGNLPASTLTLGSDREEDLILRDRDRKIEETRGGFVLQSRMTADETVKKKRMLLDKYGRPSLRKTIVDQLKLIRQKSTGDIQEQPRSSSRQSGGSVRSTVSTISQNSAISGKTSPSSVYSEDEGSFVSQTDIADGNVIERYLGEWKGDKRAGFGICERSDGLKYEGEWLNNKKYGYGVTTLKDGTRFEGKYKNNVLITPGKSSKLFVLRSTKVKDRVEGAVIGAHRAASIATQKADIANARMQSARQKSDQAEEAAKRATADAEAGRSKAREYSPDANYKGAKVIANRLQEDELLAEFAEFETNAESVQSQPPSTKKFSFFNRLKKPEFKPKPDIRTTVFNEPLMKPTSQTLSYSSAGQPLHNSGQTGRLPQNHNTISAHGLSQPQTLTSEQFYQLNNNNNNNSRTLQSNSTSPHSYNSPPNSGGPVRAPLMPTFNTVNGFQTRQQLDGPMYERSVTVSGGPLNSVPAGSPTWQPDNVNHSLSYDDAYNMAGYGGMKERRKSLPSIVKQKTDIGPVQPHQQSSSKPEASKGFKNQPSTPTGAATGTGPVLRQHVDTFVIEDGVRKRVKSLYGDDLKQLANPSARVKPTASKLPKLYALESPKLYRKGDKGSVPDVSTVRDDEVLPREVVYVMSQHRREELMVERAEAERRRRNQIVLRLGDFKEWCGRRRVFLFLLTINISLAAVFYSMLYQ